MSTETISTRPPNAMEEALRQKFAESFTGQNELMDKLGQQLITLELAVPGLYATVLKLVHGGEATAPVGIWLYVAFGCWFLALLVTLWGLFPTRWHVDPSILKREPGADRSVIGLEEFFVQSARVKYWSFLIAALLFAAGVFGAALSIL